jgi:4-hydroxy-tetrahydrodipicolinate synthase
MIGIEAGPLRLPLTEMEDGHKKVLEDEMRSFGLIK